VEEKTRQETKIKNRNQIFDEDARREEWKGKRLF